MESDDHGDRLAAENVTVRDYFAGKALVGLLANPNWNGRSLKDFGVDDPAAAAAETAYHYADAVLRRRAKGT